MIVKRLFVLLFTIFAFIFGAASFINVSTADDSSLKSTPAPAAPLPSVSPYSDDDPPFVKIMKLKAKLKENPNDADILIELGEEYLQIDNPTEAKNYFSAGLMKDPDGERSNLRRLKVQSSYALSEKYTKDSVTIFEEHCSKLNKLTNIGKNAKSNCFYYLGESYGTVNRYDCTSSNGFGQKGSKIKRRFWFSYKPLQPFR